MIRRLVAAAAMALVAGGVVAVPAAAEPTGDVSVAAREDCGAGNFCAWVNPGFNDGPGQWPGNAPNYTKWGHRSCGLGSLWTWTNCATSVYNHGNSCTVTIYSDINYRGAYIVLPRGSYLADMRADRMSDGASANDRVSSHAWSC